VNKTGGLLILATCLAGCSWRGADQSEPQAVERRGITSEKLEAVLGDGTRLIGTVPARYVIYEPAANVAARPHVEFALGSEVDQFVTARLDNPSTSLFAGAHRYQLQDPRMSREVEPSQVDLKLAGVEYVAVSGNVTITLGKNHQFSAELKLVVSPTDGRNGKREVSMHVDGAWVVDCHALISDRPNADGSPGNAEGSTSPQWRADSNYDTPFCAKAYGQLSQQ
jgi:hypothetical protein